MSAADRDRPPDAFVHRIDRRFFYGWLMVAAGALILFASGPGQSHTFGVFLTEVTRDLRLSHTEVSFAYGAATLAAAFGLPFAGRHVDRRGARRVLAVVSLLLGGAAIAFGFVNGLVVLALGFAAVRYLGQGCLFLCANNVVAQWFERRRGFALSLVWLGFSASVALHPPFAQWLIETVGWREAWLWLGLSSWALLLPVLWLVRNRPEDVGLRPDGGPPLEPEPAGGAPSEPGPDLPPGSADPPASRDDGYCGRDTSVPRESPGSGPPASRDDLQGPAARSDAPDGARADANPPAPPRKAGIGSEPAGPDDPAPSRRAAAHPEITGLTLRQALRTSAFWIIAGGLSLIALLMTGLFFHQVAIFQLRGLDTHVATRVFAITALVSVVSAPVLGRIMDRAPSRLVFAGALVVMATALAALRLVDDVATAVAYALVFGLANASMQVNVGYLWADYFGRRRLGSIQGSGQTALIVGASLGPLPFSLSLDLTGDYSAALVGSAALTVLAALIAAVFLRYPSRPTSAPGLGTRPA